MWSIEKYIDLPDPLAEECNFNVLRPEVKSWSNFNVVIGVDRCSNIQISGCKWTNEGMIPLESKTFIFRTGTITSLAKWNSAFVRVTVLILRVLFWKGMTE